MKLHTVTITGADDSTDIEHLADLSVQFPFVEWGILVSKSQEGGSRFPSRAWIDHLGAEVSRHSLRVAMHLCGRWMRELLIGDLCWNDLPQVANFAQTFQLNTHGIALEPAPSKFLAKLDQKRAFRTFIFQWNAFADPLARLAYDRNLDVMGLFDGSGGAGKLPDGGWPSPHDMPFRMGFAGGLGPDNVLDQLAAIKVACGDSRYGTWIDMEGRIRTDDGAQLDLSKVRKVLELVAGSGYLAPNLPQ